MTSASQPPGSPRCWSRQSRFSVLCPIGTSCLTLRDVTVGEVCASAGETVNTAIAAVHPAALGLAAADAPREVPATSKARVATPLALLAVAGARAARRRALR